MASSISSSPEVRKLHDRVTAIESELAELRVALGTPNGVPANGWRLAIEKYAGDEDLQAIFQAAMKLREADRVRARRSRVGARRAKK